MTISLIGLIGFQAFWIHHAVQMEEEVFDRNVNDALHQVVRRLETQEAVHFLKEEAPQIRAAVLSPEPPSLPEPEKPKRVMAHKTPRSPRPASAPTPPAAQAPSQRHPVLLSPNQIMVAPSQMAPVTAPNVIITRAEAATLTTGKELRTSTYLRGARVMAHGGKPVTGGQPVEIFGKGATDSVVIWKIIASQKPIIDSFHRNHPIKYLPARVDSGVVFRMSPDSLTRARQQELLRQIKNRNIQEVRVEKGKSIAIMVDTLPNKTWRQAITLQRDSLTTTVPVYAKTRRGNTVVGTASSTHGFTYTLSPTRVPVKKEKPAPAPVKKLAPEKAPHKKAEAKAQHLNQVMQQMAVEYVRKEKPLAERLQQLHLNDLLASELQARNIFTPYHCKLQTVAGRNGAEIVLASSNNLVLPANLRENEYAVRLFPNDVMTAPGFLLLNFPNRNLYVWQSLLIPSLISVLFTLIIIGTFSFTLYTILRQKKISEIKNDFINNMTHEFKTPIATISLALDALVNPKVRTDEARVDYYARIIKDENKRMHQQVEKVLQTAQMERKAQQLAFEKVDVHQLIRKVAEPFQLHIEQRQGVLDLKLDAQEAEIWADAGHLANMIGNLLDNANKYSPNAPKIVIQTSTIAKGLHITVEDQGVGMSREAQKRVFEKFYRVPTGNVHNVKGFGLGLSYVKTMAEAHSGSIHLRSELGKGSKFTLWLPFQKHVS
ncbi:hypothetical protein GCM10011405_18150 [Rufibacter glacialis]|nr:hypothetical protein GCM10011405_18150 [Rufibacter glacialis]